MVKKRVVRREQEKQALGKQVTPVDQIQVELTREIRVQTQKENKENLFRLEHL